MFGTMAFRVFDAVQIGCTAVCFVSVGMLGNPCMRLFSGRRWREGRHLTWMICSSIIPSQNMPTRYCFACAGQCCNAALSRCEADPGHGRRRRSRIEQGTRTSFEGAPVVRERGKSNEVYSAYPTSQASVNPGILSIHPLGF